MAATTEFRQPVLGVIEAYYGRYWSMFDRNFVATELVSLGFTQFIYAPKNDASLRVNWRQPWSDSELGMLQSWMERCRELNIEAGLGISLWELNDLSNNADREALNTKLDQLNTLRPNSLIILFDDMQSTGQRMAINQLSIIDYVVTRANVENIIVCPSYYSTDHMLEQLFGKMPRQYWHQLGLGLDPSINFYWTGEKVCSEEFTRENLDFIANEFCRLPVLWDNYPVNDGKLSSQFLHLLPYSGRANWLLDYSKAHHVNPMNQAHLSLLPLATLPTVYRDNECSKEVEVEHSWRTYVQQRCDSELAQCLIEDISLFQHTGRDNIPPKTLAELRQKYASFNSVYACEILAWLKGEYAFDPACLTG